MPPCCFFLFVLFVTSKHSATAFDCTTKAAAQASTPHGRRCMAFWIIRFIFLRFFGTVTATTHFYHHMIDAVQRQDASLQSLTNDCIFFFNDLYDLGILIPLLPPCHEEWGMWWDARGDQCHDRTHAFLDLAGGHAKQGIDICMACIRGSSVFHLTIPFTVDDFLDDINV